MPDSERQQSVEKVVRKQPFVAEDGYGGEYARQLFGPPHEMQVTRDGDRDLHFRGWRIGSGMQGTPGTRPGKWERWTVVHIRLTTGLRYVVSSMRGKRGPNGDGPMAGAVCETPDEVIAWLTADGGGKLGKAGKTAWLEACRAWPPLAKAQGVIVK